MLLRLVGYGFEAYTALGVVAVLILGAITALHYLRHGPAPRQVLIDLTDAAATPEEPADAAEAEPVEGEPVAAPEPA